MTFGPRTNSRPPSATWGQVADTGDLDTVERPHEQDAGPAQNPAAPARQHGIHRAAPRVPSVDWLTKAR